MTALYGDPDPTWWELAKRFMPETADLYEGIINDAN
jgi:hypothetical protein